MLEPPSALVKNGHALFGTFAGHVSQLDIRGLHSPFGGVPLPVFISNFRIKSSLLFNFNAGAYQGLISFFDNKMFGLVEIDLWNKENGRKYVYRNLMGPRHRFIPHNLEQGFCASFNPRRYVRISWDHKRDRISIIFNLKGTSGSPSVQAALTGHFSDPASNEVTQCVPLKSRRRCCATYVTSQKLRGTLTIGKTKKSAGQVINVENETSVFSIKRAYYGYRTQEQKIFASGDFKGRSISFVLNNSLDSVSLQEAVNQNVLMVDGNCTTLPPVKMTQPFGVKKKWIIQDTENMVDLTFVPVSRIYRELSLFAFKIVVLNLYGKFEGVFKTKDGEDITVSGFGGLAREQLLRV